MKPILFVYILFALLLIVEMIAVTMVRSKVLLEAFGKKIVDAYESGRDVVPQYGKQSSN